MKAILYFLFLFSIFFAFGVFAQIQITEIMYNPDGNDDGREWVEAVNFGSPINIKTGKDGWKLNDGKNHYLQTEETAWNQNAAVVFVEDQAKFLKDYPLFSGKLIESSFYLKNSEGTLKFFDENKSLIVETNYTDIADSGYSIVFNNGWQKGTQNGSPGIYPNSAPAKEPQIIQKNNVSSVAENKSDVKNSEIQSTTQTSPQIEPIITITTTTAIIKSPTLFINEFLPALKGKDDSEFIELINPDKENINLADFLVKVGDKKVKLQGETAEKFIVLSKSNYGFSIRNQGETIILFYKGNEAHKISYSGKAQTEKSFAKINSSWFWTKPTPGEENILVEISNAENQKSSITENANKEVFQEEFSSEFLANIQKSGNKTNNTKNFFNPIILGIFIAVTLSIVVVLFFK
ncbi:MAG: hypothetical protein AAB371_01420 [Patescibacteria group bacterium]